MASKCVETMSKYNERFVKNINSTISLGEVKSFFKYIYQLPLKYISEKYSEFEIASSDIIFFSNSLI